MTDIETFTQVLELSTPWEVMEVSFKKEGSKKVLHIHVGYQKGRELPRATAISTITK